MGKLGTQHVDHSSYAGSRLLSLCAESPIAVDGNSKTQDDTR